MGNDNDGNKVFSDLLLLCYLLVVVVIVFVVGDADMEKVAQ